MKAANRSGSGVARGVKTIMPRERIGSDDLVAAALLAMKRGADALANQREFSARWVSHLVVLTVAVFASTVIGCRTQFSEFDFASLSGAATLPSAFSSRPTGTGGDVLVKPASVVTQLVNRPRQGLVTHIVQQGETVSSIAEAYNVSVNTILWANGLREESAIQPGDKIVVLPVSGVLHEVRGGESVEDIARRYQSDVEAIVDFNQMTDPQHLVAGDKLVIPGGRPEPPARMEASARSGERPRVDEAQVEEKKAKPMEVSTYRVSEGDTLGSIAERHGVTVETILQANDLDDPELIHEGQELTILPVDGLLYTVESGDNLIDLAERFQADVEEIIKANVLADAGSLQVGQKLIIPGGKLPPPVVAAPAAPQPAPAPVQKPQAQAQQAPPPANPAPASPPAAAGSNSGSTIVGIASKYLGTRYVWGGHSPAGFDCSGFTWYVYQQAGLYLPMHDLWGQLQAGPRIKQDSLQPGDLVFFENTYTWGLSHVGIYIGGGRFIHAASEWQGVRVNALSDSYWSARYFGASRPY